MLVLLAVISMWMSYNALREFARACGFSENLEWFFPLILDLVVITTMLIALTTEHARGYAWATMGVFGFATVGGNSVHVLTIDPSLITVPLWIAIIAGSLPALSLLTTVHLAAVTTFRPRSPQVTAARPSAVVERLQTIAVDHGDQRSVVIALGQEGRTVAEIHRRTTVSRTTIARWLAADDR